MLTFEPKSSHHQSYKIIFTSTVIQIASAIVATTIIRTSSSQRVIMLMIDGDWPHSNSNHWGHNSESKISDSPKNSPKIRQELHSSSLGRESIAPPCHRLNDYAQQHSGRLKRFLIKNILDNHTDGYTKN